MRIRPADRSRDAEQVARIYRPAVEDTHVSFEEFAPSATEMASRMRTVVERYPWLVAEDGGHVVGYAYASEHRSRAGYRWSVDLAVYVEDTWHRRGVGRALYGQLLPILRRQGFANAYAGVCLPNPGSVALHESIGMTLVGVYERVGWKFDRWWDVAWYSMRLTEPDGLPAEPLPVESVIPFSTSGDGRG